MCSNSVVFFWEGGHRFVFQIDCNTRPNCILFSTSQLLNLLEKNVHDLDVKLQEAENYSNQWKPVTIDIAQDQSDNMKV
jgi:hypothetical protein